MQTIPIRIVLVAPPAGITYSLRRGGDEHYAPRVSDGSDLVFDLDLDLRGGKTGDTPRLTGPFVTGKPDDRFVRINIGTLAGDAASEWTRAARERIGGITWAMVREVQASTGVAIQGRFEGTSKRGGPACARLEMIEPGWVVV